MAGLLRRLECSNKAWGRELEDLEGMTWRNRSAASKAGWDCGTHSHSSPLRPHAATGAVMKAELRAGQLLATAPDPAVPA